ncbi:Mpv17 / PMP22 family [Seminavis robusta]|uniref:Mpv17 / PMP22 family n=1 Tax=Seminavis robusta TaxID=568900 RepID=A0A9N8HUS4_9STRA|nr:Mpv17 / PMP22 family [Seminavis robusta]|eukprot:Sro1692_g291530.1 Mpv17 / PMP22 family (177) ;mRNA; f:13527-14057
MLLKKAFQAALQSSCIMTVADVGTQWIVEGKNFSSDYDGTRTCRWTMAGFLHGPYFFAGFSMVDQRLGAATSLKVVAQKTAIAQFVLFPPYLVALFGLMGVLERHPNILDKIQAKVPEAFLSGCIYWPVANGINFALIPASLRVPYVASAAGLWNCYLSWENARDSGGKESEDETQ